jgi:hypothetical protein
MSYAAIACRAAPSLRLIARFVEIVPATATCTHKQKSPDFSGLFDCGVSPFDKLRVARSLQVFRVDALGLVLRAGCGGVQPTIILLEKIDLIRFIELLTLNQKTAAKSPHNSSTPKCARPVEIDEHRGDRTLGIALPAAWVD